MKRRPPQPWPAMWFTRRAGYIRFMIREFTAVVLAGYLIFLLVLLARVGQGADRLNELLTALRNPLSVVLHVIVLAAALYHAITWFNLTPRILPIRIGEDRVPDAVVWIGACYLPWVVVTVVIGWVLLR